MEAFIIPGFIFSIIIIISIYDAIKKKDISIENDERHKLIKDFEQCELIPSTLDGSSKKNNIYQQYFKLKYPNIMLFTYNNHCWKCKSPINNRIHLECPKCGWYICEKCETCHCDYGKEYLIIYKKEIDKMLSLSDESIIKKRFILMNTVKQKQSEYLLSNNILLNKQRPIEKKVLKELIDIALILQLNDDNYQKLKQEYIYDLENEKLEKIKIEEQQVQQEKARLEREFKLRNEINNIKKSFAFDYCTPHFHNLENELAYWKNRVKEIELEKEKQRIEEERKYHSSFKYLYKKHFEKDKHIIQYFEYPHKVELLINVSDIETDKVESYLSNLINISIGFLMVISVIINNDNKKQIVKNLNCKRIQKFTCYKNDPNKVVLLIEPK
jgi:hypothetical protein